jgi:hypothetical protein
MRITNSIMGLTARAMLKLAAGLGLAALALTGHAGTMSVNANCAGGSNYSMYSVTVDSSGNYTINCSGTATTTAPTPVPGTIAFSPTGYTGNTSSTVNVTVTRSGGSSGAVGATYTTTGACTPSSGPVSFADTVTTSQNIAFTTPATAGICTVTLSAATGNASLGSPATLTVVDPNAPGKIAFTSASQAATAGQANTVTISASRPGAGSQALAATADYACVVATAPTGGAYAPTFTPAASGTLSWAANDVSAKPITASIPAFATGTNGATITCTLSNVTGTATLGSPAQHVVSIAAPSSTPVGCVVKDKTALWPSWISGQGYNTSGTPLDSQPSSEIWAFKFPVSQLLGTNVRGLIYLYEAHQMMTVSITTSPCIFTDTPALAQCQLSSDSGFWSMRYFMNSTPNSDTNLAAWTYCRLPPLPSGQDYYYINARFAGPATTIVNPTSNTCAGSACTYFLMYDNNI